MKVVQFRYGVDNLGYLLHGDEFALAIDGGATVEIMNYLSSNGLKLKFVTNTHSHRDHTCGNSELLRLSEAELINGEDLGRTTKIELEGESIRVMHTPGHTADSVCFSCGNVIIAGDTLFNGKVGRCFTGDFRGFLQSIKRILAFPVSTVLYAGHDYVLEYLDTAAKLEPDNTFIGNYRERYNPDLVRATLEEEIRVDPFLRFNEPEIVNMLKDKGLPVDTEFDRFRSIMSLM